MLLKKMFYKELVGLTTKFLIVLVIILPVTELFKKLEEAASGSIPSSTLFALMLYGTIASFPMILTMACFMAIAITINRYCKDHEFVVWLSSGVSAFSWLKFAAYFAVPMTLICAVCSTIIMPWATLKCNEYINYLVKQQATLAISPGVFKENNGSNTNQVFYLDHYSIVDGYAANLFVQYDDEKHNLYNIVASSGKIIDENGVLSIILRNGYKYDLANSNPEQNIVVFGFKQFKASIKQEYTPLDKTQVNISTSSIQKLFQTHNNTANAELAWRISIAIMTFVMCLFVVPLSVQTGRVQGSLILILPPVIYSIYESIIITFRSYLDNNQQYALLFIILTHTFMLLFAITLTYIKTKPKHNNIFNLFKQLFFKPNK